MIAQLTYRLPIRQLFVLIAAWNLSSCSKPEAKIVTQNGENPSAEQVALEASVPIAEIPIGKVVDWESEVDNPATDGWETEVSAAAAMKQWRKFGELLGSGTTTERDAFAPFVATPFQRSILYPKLEMVSDSGLVSVERFEDGGGIDAAAFDPNKDTDFHSKFKIISIEAAGESFITKQLVSISWKSPEEVVEQHSTWITAWNRQTPPKIESLEVTDFEQTRTRLAGQTMFSDCTESALGANPSYRGQLLYGLNHWHERMPHLSILNSMSTPGLAVGDVNGDGLDDLYLCQDPRLPNRLFLQNPDGTLRDASAEWGVDWLEDSRSALIVDLDNDGDCDLAVAILGHVIVASNQENQRFQLELVLPVSESTVTLTAADYDRDGRLDLYVCGYAPDISRNQASSSAAGFGSDQFVYHDANNSVANSLLRNETTPEGGWKFTDVTGATGLDVNNRRWSFAASWEDYDNDGDPDLYVANDFGRNNLYRNDSDASGAVKFVDVAAALGVEDGASGMSVSWGDYDRDGWMDVYVSNMFSAAGNRIIPQANFKPQISDELRNRYQHFARGNTLLHNLGDGGGFSDTSVSAGVTMGRWAWGSRLADLNNDGWEDLVVANGNITADADSGDL